MIKSPAIDFGEGAVMPTLVLTALSILAEPFVLARASPIRVSSGAVEWLVGSGVLGDGLEAA